MRTVMFTFRPEVPLERQEALLTQIGTWEGIHKVGPIKPEATRAEIRRMCYAYVEDSANIERIVERFAKLPEIESAFLPAERRLR